jgi:hypothetical protein
VNFVAPKSLNTKGIYNNKNQNTAEISNFKSLTLSCGFKIFVFGCEKVRDSRKISKVLLITVPFADKTAINRANVTFVYVKISSLSMRRSFVRKPLRGAGCRKPLLVVHHFKLSLEGQTGRNTRSRKVVKIQQFSAFLRRVSIK